MRCRQPHASATINEWLPFRSRDNKSQKQTMEHVKTDAIARKLIVTSSRYDPRGIEYHQPRITHITPQQVIIKASGRLDMSLHPVKSLQSTGVSRELTEGSKCFFFFFFRNRRPRPSRHIPPSALSGDTCLMSGPMSTLRPLRSCY